MKKLIIIFSLIVLINTISFSQSCLPEGIHFTSQAQIDNFQVNYPNCTEILGSVWLEGDPPTDITNLNGLNVLTSLGGNLWIGSSMWPGGCIGLQDLTNLSGLNNVISIGGNFHLCGCPLIADLAGLESLASVGGGIFIYDNWLLSSLSGLENLDSIGYSLMIGEVTEMGNTHGNKSLKSISALENLTYVGLSIQFAGNDSLSSLAGLENLTSIGGYLWIIENGTLTSLAGLENIAAASIDSLAIVNNNLLSTCDVQSICEYLAAPNGTNIIEDNAPGCNNPVEVEEACESNGVEENIHECQISIYPNPATDNLTISNNDRLKIESVNIYNQVGQKVLQINEIGETIDISTLGQGIYIIELTSSELKIRQKLIIEE